MNHISKTLREIEANVLPDFPQEDTVFAQTSFSTAEFELHKAANVIRDNLRATITIDYLNDDKIPIAERNSKAEEVLSKLSPGDNLILEKSQKFWSIRIFKLFKEQFEVLFPLVHKPQVGYRLAWFTREISRLLNYYILEDEHWVTRDDDKILTLADDEEFWNELDVKVKQQYPEGIFTRESWEEFEQSYIEPLELDVFRRYFKDHPDKLQGLEEDMKADVDVREQIVQQPIKESLEQPVIPIEPLTVITADKEEVKELVIPNGPLTGISNNREKRDIDGWTFG